MAHTTQNSSKKNLWKNLHIMSSKKRGKKKCWFHKQSIRMFFFFFFFFFGSKTKFIYDFPKPKSQTPKDSKRITTFIKSTKSDFTIKIVSYHHSILLLKKKKKSKPLSLAVVYSYMLGSNGTTMLELCRCHCKVEDLKVEGKQHYFLFECIWDYMTWRAVDMCI